MNTKLLSLFFIVLISSDAVIKAETYNGQATYSVGLKTGTQNCSFKWTVGTNRLLTGVSQTAYDNSKGCGGCIKVTGPNGNSIVVFVTDSGGSGENGLNLSDDAFEQLADKSKGNIEVTWEWVECPVEDSDLKVVFSPDANDYYLALQVVDHKLRVEKMEMKINGEYESLNRETHNYFTYQPQNGGPVTFPIDVKVTLVDGSSIEKTLTEITSDPSDGNSGDKDPEAAGGENESESEGQNEIELTKEDLESVYPLIVFGFMQVKEIFNMILGMLGTIKELLIVETLLNVVE